MNGITRVFPRQTNCTPIDDYVFFGEPGLFIPDHNEVHICCIFTWDKPQAEKLAESWRKVSPVVKLGGPAYDDPSEGEFIPGMYVRQGITFTSRGCPNNCKFCFVPKREGKLREIEIKAGNVINDNNILACSKKHREKVYDMLKTQKRIEFKGGLEAGRLTDWDIEQMRNLRIKQLWFACDHPNAIKIIQKVAPKLYKAGYKRDHLHCYVLIGDDMTENENRLKAVFEAGMLPYAQLFQPEEQIDYSKEWKRFARTWSRPAAYKALMKEAPNEE